MFHSETSEFETTMIARLPLDAVDCSTDGGVSCMFDNGHADYGVQSPMMECPTGVVDNTILYFYRDFVIFNIM